ncbi:hypothetical protein B6V00_03940 [ANME-1 cluster archaeon ex4572_4]|nr:DUF2124 domain-containing protein [Methanophagales archaeon]OYT66115.1 MAG: hypothetical protein B6V00_03940 [ANME-1 cluster archaeon ex4572_4]RLF32301.1 MAG: DUF2124 domain-containing protein [Thermoplasmata archaeon]HDN67982.1 DUF2124 domain-containing protein [Methanomicrobia archaeon]
MEKKRGIVGFTGTFRECVADVSEGSKVVFTGSVAVCTPFIELLAYTVRDRGFEMLYVPRADATEARKIKEIANVGYSVVDEKGDPKGADAVVVLGGLAMPKFGCEPEKVVRLIEELSGEKEQKPKIVGVGFMNIFENAGWVRKIHFDTLMDTTMESEVK